MYTDSPSLVPQHKECFIKPISLQKRQCQEQRIKHPRQTLLCISLITLVFEKLNAVHHLSTMKSKHRFSQKWIVYVVESNETVHPQITFRQYV